MNRRHRLRSRRGFTMVEMVVAVLLLAIGVVACLGAIGVSTRATGVADQYTTATLLADRHFAELKSDPNMLMTGDESGDFGAQYPGYSWSQSIEQTDITGLLRVSVTVEWTDGIARKSTLFTTYEPQPQTTDAL